MGAAHIHNLLT